MLGKAGRLFRTTGSYGSLLWWGGLGTLQAIVGTCGKLERQKNGRKGRKSIYEDVLGVNRGKSHSSPFMLEYF